MTRGAESREEEAPCRPQNDGGVTAPMMVATVWKIVFAERSLDTDQLVSTHIDMLISYLKADGREAG